MAEQRELLNEALKRPSTDPNIMEIQAAISRAERPKELLECRHYIWEHGPRGLCPRR